MDFRVISISDKNKSSVLSIYEWFTGVPNEYTLNPAEVQIEDTDRMVVIWAQDNYDKAVELGRRFHQAGVLTIGVFPEYIEGQGCFDAQTINDGKSILSIVRALTAPVIYSGPICFDFNDVHATLKGAGKFYARFIYGSDMDSLISIVSDNFKHMDLSNVESVCINLYGELKSDFWNYATDKIGALLSMMPRESSVHFGVHKLPDSFTGIWEEMKSEMSFGISFILAEKDIRI